MLCMVLSIINPLQRFILNFNWTGWIRQTHLNCGMITFCIQVTDIQKTCIWECCLKITTNRDQLLSSQSELHIQTKMYVTFWTAHFSVRFCHYQQKFEFNNKALFMIDPWQPFMLKKEKLEVLSFILTWLFLFFASYIYNIMQIQPWTCNFRFDIYTFRFVLADVTGRI